MTGTPVEQAFCLTATKIRANQSSDTNAKNMNHATSITGAITREMRQFEESLNVKNKRSRKHLLRSATSQRNYLQRLRKYGVTLAESVTIYGEVKVPTVVEMRLKGKKVMKLTHSLPHTLAEMAANAPRGVVKIDGNALVCSVCNSTQAKLNSWTTCLC